MEHRGIRSPKLYTARSAYFGGRASLVVWFLVRFEQIYSCLLPGEIVRECVEQIRAGVVIPQDLITIAQLIVDEYQDLNPMDLEFVAAIINGGSDFCGRSRRSKHLFFQVRVATWHSNLSHRSPELRRSYAPILLSLLDISTSRRASGNHWPSIIKPNSEKHRFALCRVCAADSWLCLDGVFKMVRRRLGLLPIPVGH